MVPGYHARAPGCDRDADRAHTHAAKPSHSNYNRVPMLVAIPARVHNVDAARSQFGARVDRLIAALERQDPLADAAAAALSELPTSGHALVDAALRGATADAPPALRELLASVAEFPRWVDWTRVERGCHLFLRAGFAGGLVLGMRSLPYGYAAPAGNKPLVFSGRLAERAPRRLAETARFVAAVSEPGGLRRRDAGFAITLKVRLMHAQVRRLLLASDRWDAAAWSAPINQHDMLATIFLFSQVFLDGLRLLGLRIDRGEGDDFIHLWRVIGWLIGVDDDLLPDDEATARAASETIYLTQGPPDADARALVAALLNAPAQTAHTPAEQRRARTRMHITRQLCRHLLGNPLADSLAVPHERPALATPILVRTLTGLDRARARLPALERLAAQAGRRYWDGVVALGLGDQPADFAPPARLARLPG